MRTRDLKPGFFKNEHLAQLHPLARILFAGLWGLADRDGILEDRPQRIKVDVLPYDDFDVNSALDRLAEGHHIARYADSSGNRLIQVRNFKKHQHIHPKEKPSAFEPCNYTDLPSNSTDEPCNSREFRSEPSLSSLPSLPSLSNYVGVVAQARPAARGKRKKPDPDPNGIPEQIIAYCAKVTGRNFQIDNPAFLRMVGRAIKEDGCTLETAQQVIDFKWAEWGGDPENARHVNPVTLFRKSRFLGYLGMVEAGAPKQPLTTGSHRPFEAEADPEMTAEKRLASAEALAKVKGMMNGIGRMP